MSFPENFYDVIIVGAGICGCMTARELSRYNLRVLVIEASDDVATGATKANSGIVHGGFAEGKHELKGRLAVQGRHMFAQLEHELNFGFRVTGSLVVSFDDDLDSLNALLRQGLENGLDDLRILGRAELRDRELNINRQAKAALLCEGAGVCSPWDLAIAAMENAIRNGAELKLNTRLDSVEYLGSNSSTLERVASDGGSQAAEAPLWQLNCTGALTQDTLRHMQVPQQEAVAQAPRQQSHSLRARYVINAAGLHAAEVDALAEFKDLVIKPRSGQYLIFGQGSGSLVQSVLFGLPGPLGKGILVGPTYQNNLLVGPDAKNHDPAFNEADLKSTDPERLAKVLSQARNLVEGIDTKLVIRSFAGIRAAAEYDGGHSGDFVIGRAGQGARSDRGGRDTRYGWYHLGGIQSPGLTASPAIAQMMVHLLEQDGLKLHPKNSFDPYRAPFSSHLSLRHPALDFSKVNELTKLSPGNPERMICRCEQVREKDLTDACSRTVPVLSTDAAKRRTRAGMGWCQGQFCRPRVAEFLSRGRQQAVGTLRDFEKTGAARVEGKELRDLD